CARHRTSDYYSGSYPNPFRSFDFW
nr:immunoglobulin heavy chain junction region [Macaca mulatta]MOX62285.1 immunoglobulin heavy chain junction region [Macaca mulatta]MOX65720.1 immunoglobulin heavy chain junction region [Macaca mulatta]MOX65850.1 immunoglobulin heavy chain junction region [Macaca mulatta]MOX65939.1 immunoglobulin heavy chain junction region [Macaca mulatta]